MRTTNVDKKKQIEYIMHTFDFEKVCSVMRFLDWAWMGCGNGEKVPPVGRLKLYARAMLERVEDNSTLRAGGFCASSNEGNLMLSFEVAWAVGALAEYWEEDLT